MYRISFAAHSDPPTKDLYEDIKKLIKYLVDLLDHNMIFYLGGYYGTMKVIADEACKYGVKSVFILPYSITEIPEVPREECYIPVYTGLSMRQRSETLVLSGDVLVAVGGYAGTIIEIFIAYSNNKNSYVLTGYNYPSDLLEQVFNPYIDPRRNATIKYYRRDPEKLARELAEDLLRSVRRR
jgi:uncharacterized protein (TIGR00725 family)